MSQDNLFRQVSPRRVSTAIVGQVERAIDAGDLSIGDRLPSERELAHTFGVSRVTVRDALRVLEATGLIEVRLGAHGGAYVAAPEPTRVGETLGRMLVLGSVEPEELDEARRLFELAVLPLACSRATAADVRGLRLVLDETEAAIAADAFDVSYSVRFHVLLAAAAHNRSLSFIFESFQEAVFLTLLRARDVAPAHGLRGLGEHRQLVDAVERRDALSAHRIMEQHLRRTADARRGAPGT